MYAGTTIRSSSGDIIGVHQKIDRISRRNLNVILGRSPVEFPTTDEILHFEGNNGPDGIKRKSPSVDEPWHFIDPSNTKDRALLKIIDDHQHNLITALNESNRERAAFEAAWLAHAITDGLTPAHHYPLGDKIEELWGKPKEERITIKEKNIIHGKTRRDTISKNWEYWGAKGVFLTHSLFEIGVATCIKPVSFQHSAPTEKWLKEADTKGSQQVFLDAMFNIYDLGMYEVFWKQGWTGHLANQTRSILIPTICRVITYFWLDACKKAGL